MRITRPWLSVCFRLCVLSLFLSLGGMSLRAQEPVPLPVQKVVLYKNGMGYFEHLGPVRGSQTVEIALPSSQLNDVLKSLTVIDLGQGHVAGVTFDSTAPLDRRISELPINLSSAKGLLGFLNELRGAEVEIRASSGPVSGKLMGAELRTRSTGPGATVQEVEAMIFTPAGELRLVKLQTASALRFTSSELAGDLNRYLEVLDSVHQRDVRRLRIQAVGTGQRQLYVSYTSESPIWKTTYRIVLDAKKKPLLQGWAIVDNTTPMDWENVTLSLVAGAPVSFIQNLSQPLYARRPVVPLPQGLQVSPQVHEGTLVTTGGQTGVGGAVTAGSGEALPGAAISIFDRSGNLVRRVTAGEGGRYHANLSPGTYRIQAGLAGFRSKEFGSVQISEGRTTALDFRLASGTVTEQAIVSREMNLAKAGVAGGLLARKEAPRARPLNSRVSAAMRRQKVESAQAQALGEQFEYKLLHPVTIHRNESSLLPIIQAEVEGEKVSVYTADSGEQQPRLAVWLKNTTGLILDAGSFTVIDTNAFAGEGLTETVQRGERRLMSYALDLGVEVASKTTSENKRVERVEISRGVLRMHAKLVEEKNYVIRNNDDKPRRLVIEHPAREGWKMIETPSPVESTATYHRFQVLVDPKSTAELTVREERPLQTTYGIGNITNEQITLWLRQRSIDPEIEKALKAIVATKGEIQQLARKVAALQREQNDIFQDQERIRQNLQRLGRTPEEATLRQRYVRQLETQENRLATVRAERSRLEEARTAAQKKLDGMLQQLTFDRKL